VFVCVCVCVFLREQHDDTALCPTDDDWAFFFPPLRQVSKAARLWAPPTKLRAGRRWAAVWISLLLSLGPGDLSLDPEREREREREHTIPNDKLLYKAFQSKRDVAKKRKAYLQRAM